MDISKDTTICIGSSVSLFVNGVSSAQWLPGTYLDNASSLTPTSTPANTITYSIQGTTSDGCSFTDSVTIHVDLMLPIPVLDDTLHYCSGTSGTVTASGGTTYLWSPATAISTVTDPTVTISTAQDEYYYCDFTNACGTVRDSIYIAISTTSTQAGNDTTICPGEIAILWASGGMNYSWFPTVYANVTANGSQVIVKPQTTTTYSVIGYNAYGCPDTATVLVTLFPTPFVQTCPDVYAVLDEAVQLNATSSQNGVYVWSPSEFLSCTACQDPIALPNQNFVYTVTFYDENGCIAADQVAIKYEPLIYVPNTFTPTSDGTNDFFFAKGVNMKDFQMEIFNRWGELIFTANSIYDGWNGTYKGLSSPDGVYTWKIQYSDVFTGMRYELVGHVTLLR